MQVTDATQWMVCLGKHWNKNGLGRTSVVVMLPIEGIPDAVALARAVSEGERLCCFTNIEEKLDGVWQLDLTTRGAEVFGID